MSKVEKAVARALYYTIASGSPPDVQKLSENADKNLSLKIAPRLTAFLRQEGILREAISE